MSAPRRRVGVGLGVWVMAAVACGSSDSPEPRQDTAEPGEASAPDDAGSAASTPAAAERREEHAVFVLGHNRLLAHERRHGGLYIDAGSAGFAKYVRFGLPSLRWRLAQELAGTRAAVAEKLASIEVPLTAQEAASFERLTLRVHGSARQRLGVKVNGRKAALQQGRIELAEGWQIVSLTIDRGLLVPGENFIALEFGRSGSPGLAWLWLGPGGDELDADQETLGYDPEADAFTLPRGNGLTYYVYVPEAGELVADVDGARQGCRVDVHVQAARESLESALMGPDSGISLAALAGQVVRLDMTALGCERVRLARARLTTPGKPRTVHHGPPPRYIVLWMMDTLRADRVKPFEPKARPEVPNLERLAETGTVFRQYYVQGNESQTSHSSIWTSLYPVNHNVRTAGNGGTWLLSKRFAKLPSLLARAGLYTIGVTANGYVTKHHGYGRGFAIWRNLMREGAAKNGSVPAQEILESSLYYLGQAYKKSPVFLFLGTIDTHKPWIGREPWLTKYDPEPYSGVHERAAWPINLGMTIGSMKCDQVPEPRDLTRINAIYDSDVSYQDQQIGQLLDRLEEWGIMNETMIIVTADHGEELWEHGKCGHGGSLRETLVRVPLLIHYPPLFQGRVVEEGAEGVDLLPTILDALGLDAPDEAQGQTLIPLAQGAMTGYPMASYASQYEYAHAMRIARWKARVGRSGVPELYDVVSDPGETRNLAQEVPIARRFMTDALSMFLVHRSRWRKRIWGVANNMSAQAAADLERRGQDQKASSSR